MGQRLGGTCVGVGSILLLAWLRVRAPGPGVSGDKQNPMEGSGYWSRACYLKLQESFMRRKNFGNISAQHMLSHPHTGNGRRGREPSSASASAFLAWSLSLV